ncbi:MAG: nucleotidyltransferase domain-containing protein [Candidatus Woesearchaeota archaeon]
MLKEFLLRNREARKIFGKKEIEIILKQIEGSSLTQSEKNRLSRDIRPKFRIIEELSSFKDEFKLEKNQENKKIIEKVVEAILNDKFGNGVKAILLFGSLAEGSFHKMSDIDICVVFKNELSLKEATEFRIRVSGQLPEKIDVQVFNILPMKLKREVARTHKVLYKDSSYDNTSFSIRYIKDNDYFMRMSRIFGAKA